MSTIQKDLAHGTIYLAVAKYSGLIVSLVVASILSRILTPTDYGIAAIAFVFISFFTILSDIGIGPAIIQNNNLDDKDINNIFSLSIYSGLILCLIFFLSSSLISNYYKAPQLFLICRCLSITIFFTCINIVPTNLLYKTKNFKFVSYSTLIVQFLLGCISVLSAYYGLGIYSLILAPILSPLFLFFIYYNHNRLKFNLFPQIDSIKKIFSYSIYQFLFNILNYFSRNADKLLLGKYIGMAQLGQYEKSYRLMMLPLQNITYIITPVLHPVFSDYQNNVTEMAIKYRSVVRLLGIIGFPLSAILYFTAEPLMIIIFGPQWTPAIEPFKILSFSVGLQIITSSTASIFQASNATKRLFMTSLIVSICMIGCFLIATFCFKSIIAMAYAFVIAKTIDMFVSYISLMNNLHYSFCRFMMILVKPFMIGVCEFVILFFLNTIFKLDNIYISLIVNVICGIIGIYILSQTIERLNLFKLFRNSI